MTGPELRHHPEREIEMTQKWTPTITDRINAEWVIAAEQRNATFCVVLNPQHIDRYRTFRAARKHSDELLAAGIPHEMWLEG